MGTRTPALTSGALPPTAGSDTAGARPRLEPRRIGPGLCLALLLGALLGLHGIWWGWAETWHPDQMAFQRLLGPDRWPLEPPGFLKPPFHTYFTFIVSVVPVKMIDTALETTTRKAWDLVFLSVWWSKVVQVALFLATVYLVWRCTRRIAGARAATIMALVMATSAGFIVQAHFLTADVPVVFWMVLSFYFAQRIPADERTRDYVLAGALVGVATATKYNGLAVGIALPVFHLFATMRYGARKVLFSPRLFLGVGMVAAGFIAANPYAVLRFERFAEDFIYNYVITPVYDGNVSGDTSYGEVLPRIADIIGWPMTALVIGSSVWAAIRAARSANNHTRAGVAAALLVVALYIAKFGAFTRLETRFFLPVIPFLLIATGICWQGGRRSLRRLQNVVLIMLLAYNLLSSYWVGRRFAEDPRMEALRWVATTVRADSTFESSAYTPHWNAYPGVHVHDRRMPYIAGRRRLFANLFKGQDNILKTVRAKEHDRELAWYTPDALAHRRPDYLAMNSMYYDRFLVGATALLYPEMNEYVELLLNGKLEYEVAFDSTAKRSPRWLYPQDIDFVDSRLLILRRRAHPNP